MNTPATSTNPETYYKMPPVGMTETRVMIGEKKIFQYTVRCGAANCWFVGHGGAPGDAQITLDEHECPTPPRRNELPTGRSTLEKLWDELDDAVMALLDKQSYNGMSDVELKGYVKGIAFNLSMFCHPYFKTIKDVSREAKARYDMSKGKIPWRPTPSYRYNPMPAPAANIVKTAPAVKRAQPPRKRASQTTSRTQPDVKLSDDQIRAIKSGAASSMFTHEELANMFKTTVDQVVRIIA